MVEIFQPSTSWDRFERDCFSATPAHRIPIIITATWLKKLLRTRFIYCRRVLVTMCGHGNYTQCWESQYLFRCCSDAPLVERKNKWERAFVKCRCSTKNIWQLLIGNNLQITSRYITRCLRWKRALSNFRRTIINTPTVGTFLKSIVLDLNCQ